VAPSGEEEFLWAQIDTKSRKAPAVGASEYLRKETIRSRVLFLFFIN
jgi:hypothetical protein